MRSFALCALAVLCSESVPSAEPRALRRVISLDGAWEIAEGPRDAPPAAYPATVPVPGLVDMARPAFAEVGRKSALREAFWYRRTFAVGGRIPEFAILKIHKARYGTKVWLNGRPADEHLPCFTPACFDVAKLLEGEGRENVVVVRVGADRESMPRDVPSGWDFEKYLYIPGIYDSVELSLAGSPCIRGVQVVPDIVSGSVRIVAELECGESPSVGVPISVEIAEAASGGLAARGAAPEGRIEARSRAVREVRVKIPEPRLWSPEEPFLYEAVVRTPGDAVAVRFGMRSFRFDASTGRAVLNGRPYFLRGTNVCIYRFFEDGARGDRPWRAEWVRRLHEVFRSMGWNSMRWCIGFPPDFWYDVADEKGWLIQDEFPIWLLGEAPENPTAERIASEYEEWMRERWNHPSVVIWDAQNESHTAETGKAIQRVRALDLSNRPWENGWAEPQSPEDCVEAHPYLMIGLFNPSWGNPSFRFRDLAGVSGEPPLNEAQRRIRVPIIVNEYGWLWLNRDGSPTCLTGPVYEKLLGPRSTVEERRKLYARILAAKTELWRSRRACAGVLHFCGLGYSRAGDKPRPEGGATSDHFLDIEELTFEPHFEEYLRDAFNPVGLMLEFFDEEVPAGSRRAIAVWVIDDLPEAWAGQVRLVLGGAGREETIASRDLRVAGLGRERAEFEVTFPASAGEYELRAGLVDRAGRLVRSRREFRVR